MDKESIEWENRNRKFYPWMTDDQFECYMLLCGVFRGSHHLDGKVKEFGRGISMTVCGGKLATFDFDYLTRLVIRAHDKMIRVEIDAGGPRRVKVILHKRHTRDGRIIERHPTIEQAIETHRIKEESQ